ncbi:MAG: hypothetical protein ACRDJE_14900 [Dehalococcoidia bacterium]
MVAAENRSLHEARGSPRLTAGSPATLSIDLPRLINEQDEPMRLLASWLGEEHEGEVFFSGSGGVLTVPIPPDALGYRLRRWPSEGLAPEYLDWQFDGGEGS